MILQWNGGDVKFSKLSSGRYVGQLAAGAYVAINPDRDHALGVRARLHWGSVELVGLGNDGQAALDDLHKQAVDGRIRLTELLGLH